jgi:hypothetical protein
MRKAMRKEDMICKYCIYKLDLDDGTEELLATCLDDGTEELLTTCLDGYGFPAALCIEQQKRQPIRNPQTYFCGQGAWKDDDSEIKYWGDWSVPTINEPSRLLDIWYAYDSLLPKDLNIHEIYYLIHGIATHTPYEIIQIFGREEGNRVLAWYEKVAKWAQQLPRLEKDNDAHI